jgi:hypothetical protein
VSCEHKPNSSSERFDKLSLLMFVLKIVNPSANVVDNEMESI